MWWWLVPAWLVAGLMFALLAGSFLKRPDRPLPPSVADEAEAWLASVTAPASGG